MSRFLVVILFVFGYADEFYQSDSKIICPKIKAVEVFMKNPVMGDDSYRVYYWKNMIMYESHYRYDSSNIFLHGDPNRNFMISLRRTNYFVFEKDSAFGYNFDPSSKSQNNLRLPVDSTLKIRTLQINLDTVLYLKADTISWNNNKTELREVYFFLAKNDIPSVKYVLYYSKKLNHVKISFSQLVDSCRAMKLYKLESFFDSIFDKKENKLWPPLAYSNEIREIKVSERQFILSYFHQYENLIK